QRAGRAVIALLRREAEVVHGAAAAANDVLVLPADGRVLVEVVWVVGAHLDGRVAGAEELRRHRIGVLDGRLERGGREPAGGAGARGRGGGGGADRAGWRDRGRSRRRP